ncbi:MAG: protein kinase family protein, partial [Alphaproteobacteria bacterium]|nr:protein kinase family protein [Alphaproteobacteria bacterium]
TELACLSDRFLADLIDKAQSLHFGWGKSVLLTIDETSIFVKKVPLTDLEKCPENMMSTANLFDLPLYYQYGVGSAGFSVWRELATHIMTSNWVISGECHNFPIMYHWRVLPCLKPDPMNAEQLKELERDVQYWEKSSSIRKRLQAIHQASSEVLFFLEYVPQNLHQWLGAQLIVGEDAAGQAVSFVEQQLKTTNNFMNERGLLHFDAHFKNILTDGKLLYFTDFGLALSSKFELTKSEIEFLNIHRHYDTYSTITNLLHCIITTLFGKDNWEIRLQEYLHNEEKKLPLFIETMIRRYAPIAFAMDEFYQKLQKKSKLTPYPLRHLETLIC